eukprot:CAMPEP_0113665928 /NCGR_PEP_ID=MMETSP0038_2-20120614/2575_1 /TAXON_ID=2898 /ORGANISM="Cryptomonas paramecium" /LENGTH=55 /DNA_ID=CAMNT_0000581331 /DNA_START=360 /DNA_END=524 /DNA_ORIENTATION=+ /assembly_acc=CAM_ASM_000170
MALLNTESSNKLIAVYCQPAIDENGFMQGPGWTSPDQLKGRVATLAAIRGHRVEA